MLLKALPTHQLSFTEQTGDTTAIHQVRQRVFYFEAGAADALLSTAANQVEEDIAEVAKQTTKQLKERNNFMHLHFLHKSLMP